MATNMSPPHYRPKCFWLTDEINLSVNVSRKTVEDDGEIHYTGDTEFGDHLAPVGYVNGERVRRAFSPVVNVSPGVPWKHLTEHVFGPIMRW